MSGGGKSKRPDWESAGENVVVLHQFQRARSHPNGSPYPIKLELFLRAAGIEYINDFTHVVSKKGKSPWMTVNKEAVADSQLCIEHLLKLFPDKDLNAHLSDREKAVAKGMRSILEDNFYFVGVMRRWGNKDSVEHLFNEILPPFHGPKFLMPLIKRQVSRRLVAQAKGQGIGRHTEEEILELGKKDLKAVSDFLADKPFMMGEKFSEVDCSTFGFIVCLLCGVKEDDPLKSFAEKDLPNLKEYAERIKEKYWPDWEDCLYKD